MQDLKAMSRNLGFFWRESSTRGRVESWAGAAQTCIFGEPLGYGWRVHSSGEEARQYGPDKEW